MNFNKKNIVGAKPGNRVGYEKKRQKRGDKYDTFVVPERFKSI